MKHTLNIVDSHTIYFESSTLDEWPKSMSEQKCRIIMQMNVIENLCPITHTVEIDFMEYLFIEMRTCERNYNQFME